MWVMGKIDVTNHKVEHTNMIRKNKKNTIVNQWKGTKADTSKGKLPLYTQLDPSLFEIFPCLVCHKRATPSIGKNSKSESY